MNRKVKKDIIKVEEEKTEKKKNCLVNHKFSVGEKKS